MNKRASDEWQELNQRYLVVAIAWLRRRLEHHVHHWQLFYQGQEAEFPEAPKQAESHHKPQPVPVQATPDKQEIARPSEMVALEQDRERPPALLQLAGLLGLSEFERDVMLLCVAAEISRPIAELCGHAQGDAARAYPTFALALSLFDEPRWDSMSPERPLRYWRLLEIHQPAAQSLSTSPLRADERIVNYVQGLNYLDDRVAALVSPLNIALEDLPSSQKANVDAIVRMWQQAVQQQAHLPVIQLVGPDLLSKQLVVGQIAARFKLQLYRIAVEALPAQANDLELFARLWQRESVLFSVALYLDAQEVDGSMPNEGQVLNRFLDRSDGFFFLGAREVWSRLNRSSRVQDIDRPTVPEQEATWTKALQGAAYGSPDLLSSQFNLNVNTIRSIAQVERANSAGNTAPLADRLWDACRRQQRPRLDTLAQRLIPKATWDDLVLPAEAMSTLQQMADQVVVRYKVYETWGFVQKMNRGLGISALFSGESGTGKTMAAEVIANALRLDLYRIDLSAVVSKYIGETEKNLRRLFDAAEDGGAILFFDEADALFGKRSEVKDSHDRYANIEINYLLQRIEAYSGIAILATNLKSSLDPAFMRRLRFSIVFPFPSPTERKQIWEKVFPPQVPRGILDYERLSRFSLTGGSIHNIALNAAFRAAAMKKDTAVNDEHILAAIRAEYRKLDRPINEGEFRLPEKPSAQATGGKA
jgi:hypothetical protein